MKFKDFSIFSFLVLVPLRMEGRSGTVYKIKDKFERSSVSFQFSFGTVSQFVNNSTPFQHVFLRSGMCITFRLKIAFSNVLFLFQICLAALSAIRPVVSSYGYQQPQQTNYYTTAKPYYTTAAPYYTTPKAYYTTAAPYYTTTAKPYYTTAAPYYTTAKPYYTTTAYYTTPKPYYQPTEAYTTSKPYVQPTYTTQPTYYQPQQPSYTTPSYYPENYEGDDNVILFLSNTIWFPSFIQNAHIPNWNRQGWYNYAFKFNINDYYGNEQSRSETHENQQTRGQYSVNLPDGRKQIVTYEADENGYRAEVSYEPADISNSDNYNYYSTSKYQ